MLRTSDLEYDLPEGAIATAPAEPRDSAKLMVLWRHDPSRVEHTTIADLPRFLNPGDLLVVNSTRVLRARLIGNRIDSGGKVQGLYLGNANTHGGKPEITTPAHAQSVHHRRWVVMLQGRHLHPGVRVLLHPSNPDAKPDAIADTSANPHLTKHNPQQVILTLHHRDLHEHAAWIVGVEVAPGFAHDADFGPLGDALILERIGWTPLPPYIVKARKHRGETAIEEYDRARYQTVYAATSDSISPASAQNQSRTPTNSQPGQIAGDIGSVAAPTAGLHLTPQVLEALAAKGVDRTEVVLHVGSGTFKPVEAEFVQQHQMHTEWCALGQDTRQRIQRAHEGSCANTSTNVNTLSSRAIGRVICVGTTSARTVESFAQAYEFAANAKANAHASETPPVSSWLATDILIAPGYRWRWTDGLLTNFHLPRSTLLAMVGSLLDQPDATPDSTLGIQRLKTAYADAIARGYRFFSYGDAMLILP